MALLTLAARSVAAAPPDAAALVSKMKAALEPPKSSLRQMKLSISGEDGGTTQWTLAQARKTIDGKGRMMTVLLSPKEERGVASLLIDGDKQTKPVRALYIPTIRRVRTLTPAGAYEPMLGSDFFYADLGFISLRDKYRLLGSEQHAGKQAFKIEQTPESPWYYSKIVCLDRSGHEPAARARLLRSRGTALEGGDLPGRHHHRRPAGRDQGEDAGQAERRGERDRRQQSALRRRPARLAVREGLACRRPVRRRCGTASSSQRPRQT